MGQEEQAPNTPMETEFLATFRLPGGHLESLATVMSA